MEIEDEIEEESEQIEVQFRSENGKHKFQSMKCSKIDTLFDFR